MKTLHLIFALVLLSCSQFISAKQDGDFAIQEIECQDGPQVYEAIPWEPSDLSIVSVSSPPCAVRNNYHYNIDVIQSILIANNGTAALENFHLNWSVNNIEQEPVYYFNLGLVPGEYMEVIIGGIGIDSETNLINVWIEQVNGELDLNPADNYLHYEQVIEVIITPVLEPYDPSLNDFCENEEQECPYCQDDYTTANIGGPDVLLFNEPNTVSIVEVISSNCWKLNNYCNSEDFAVRVRLKNNGPDDLESLEFQWTKEGILQTPTLIEGISVAPGDSVNVTAALYNLNSSDDEVTGWITKVNDQVNENYTDNFFTHYLEVEPAFVGDDDGVTPPCISSPCSGGQESIIGDIIENYACTDVSITDFESTLAIDTGLSSFYIAIVNNGPEELNSVTVNWSIDGVAQTPYELVDFDLSAGASYELNIGSFDFENEGEYELAISVENPNGVTDCNTENDDFFSIITVANPTPCTDASIATLLTATTLAPGVSTFQIGLLNNGPEELNSVTVNWSIDGVAQTPYELVDFDLPAGASYELNIGSFDFENEGEYELAISVENPNGVTDCNTENDDFFSTITVLVADVPCTDASIAGLLSTSTPEIGITTFQIDLLNNGPEELNSVTVNWSIDGVDQTPYELTDFDLIAGSSYALNIGSFNFETEGEFLLEIEVNNPNGVEDCNTGNDTFFATISIGSIDDIACSGFSVDYTAMCAGNDETYMVLIVPISTSSSFLVTDNNTGELTTYDEVPFTVGPFDNQAGFDLSITDLEGDNCSASISEMMVDCQSTAIELTGFNVQDYLGGNKIDWGTASEFESLSFVIEHSTDGLRFTEIGSAKAAGFSNTKLSYEFNHLQVEAVVNYYRLAETDVHGDTRIVSSVLSVDNSKQANAIDDLESIQIQVFPNPAIDYLQIETDAINSGSIRITDLSGRIISETPLQSKNARINCQDWLPGIYLISIETATQKSTARMIKSH